MGWLWYRGERFCGFQRQVHARSVQGTLEEALGRVGAEPTVTGAGRTDKGVHARMQVVAFRAPRSCAPEVQSALNSSLLPDAGLAFLKPAPPKFHPQWSATGKTYRYQLARWTTEALDLELLTSLLGEAVGTRDFGAFHPNSSPRRPRTVSAARVLGHTVQNAVIEVQGDGFARHQVRYLVGSAVATARGQLRREEWTRALTSAEAIAGVRAPADGLTLWEVHYPLALDPFTAEERRAEITAVGGG